MPGTSTTGSDNISLLDSRIYANLCTGKFYIDLSPSIWIGTGYNNVLGANVEIKNPLGVTVKPYGSNYEISPALSGGMDAVIPYNIPTQASNFQYGTYTINVQLFDAGGNSWIVSKPVTICEPDQLNKTRNFGTLSAKLTGVCKDGKLFVIVNNVPTYKGTLVESQVNDFVLEYPTSSGLTPLSASVTNFTVVLFEGIYKLTGTVCALYNLGDNIYVQVLYKIKIEKNQKCMIDECCVQQQFSDLINQLGADCTPAEKENTANIILEALLYIKEAELAATCGADPSNSITALEKLLGCSCTCACNDGTPIIDLTPSRDVVIQGCNVEKTSVGLTDTYTINNYEYIVGVNDNGGAVTITAASTNGCVKTQQISFNISVVYAQIKAQVNNNTEYNIWASFINKTLNGLDASCLGLTPQQWALMTFRERFAAVMNMFCVCCACIAEISNVLATQSGFDIVFTWDEANLYSVDIYIDDTLVATILAGVQTYTYIGSRGSDPQYKYRLVPKCANGSIGTPVEGSTQFTGKVFLAAPSVYTNHLVGNCPYDLTTNVLALPLGVNAEWHTANNTLASSLVPNPTLALQGTYYVFAKDDNNFYSEGVQVTLVCDSTGSCSAPQNLSVVPAFGGNLVQFQSAAYPPPLNSYTVKRRLKSDTDVPGNYTTIGTPSWNVSANRWQINDPSAVSNVLYVYRAFSNCGGTAPYIDFEFASIICPTLSLTPKVSEIDYSFEEVGGEVTKYEVTAYEADRITPIHTNTHTIPVSDPILGNFLYLDSNTIHYIGIKIYIGTYVKECALINTRTLNNTATLVIDYVAGIWSAVLNNALASSLIVSASQVKGSTSNICGSTLESDTMPTMTIPAGELSAEVFTGLISYLSTYYKIDDGVTISGYGSKVNGGTFVKDGCTVTVQINHITCGYYPA